jgi:hypothetical protein
MPSLENRDGIFFLHHSIKINFIPHSLTFLSNQLNSSLLQGDGLISIITKPSPKGMNPHLCERNLQISDLIRLEQ